MSRTCCIAICLVSLVTMVAGPARAGEAVSQRGIAVLASSIGADCSPKDLAEFVRQAKCSQVVVDWAWITYHWDHTNFSAVNEFMELMSAKNVPVVAMYRPRFISSPTVATQMGEDRKRSTDHAEICYSDPEARKWGAAWGEKILEKCPGFKEVIVYNPTNGCRCPQCTAAGQGTYAAVVSFLSQAKAAWREKHPGVKLGVVSMAVPDFWKACKGVVDVAHPFLRVRDDVDLVHEAADIQALKDVVGDKMGSCLAKITWEEGARVSIDKLVAADAIAGREGIPYFIWTFDTLFTSSLYDPAQVAKALGIDTALLSEALSRMRRELPAGTGQPVSVQAGAQGELTYTPEQIRKISVEMLIERMQQPEPGYHRFAALWGLTQKIAETTGEAHRSMMALVIAAMKDLSRSDYQRFQCCYVISGCKDEEGIPDLIDILLQDKSETMRAVAAEALCDFPNSKTAYDALMQAARTDTSPMVREVLERRLGKDIPSPDPGAQPGQPVPAPELAPSGPPQPPDGPAAPVAQPLPWPFPGDYKAQKIFNNYQQATDMYIHCGIDLIQPAGTAVSAIASGYVAAISTNYPDWITHHFFIVTPQKGGNRGWCYTHLDPRTFTFKVGDYIRQGQRLGSLVDFSVGNQPGVAHLHLHYVSFSKDEKGAVKVHSLIDPLYFFDWKDTQAPTFQPLIFVEDGKSRQFHPDNSGIVTVSGQVDILAAIADAAFPDHVGNLGVPVVMLSISDGTHTMQKLVLDHRGEVGDETRTKPLYLSYEERKAFINPDSFPRYQMLRVTKTDGDGRIEAEDVTQCWDTLARDSDGNPRWPNGRYSVNVYAWDIAGNRGCMGALVDVKN